MGVPASLASALQELSGGAMLGLPYRTRLSVLFAPKAHQAVILRRGPRTHFRLIAWDLRYDTFTPGQWMKGIIKLGDLSPSGDKLIYWAAQYHQRRLVERTAPPVVHDPLNTPDIAPRRVRPKRRIPRYKRSRVGEARFAPRPIRSTWTAISKPPYFTALALWPSFYTLSGGGLFRSEREIVLWETPDGTTPAAGAPIPRDFRVLSSVALGEEMRRIHPLAYCPSLRESEEHLRIASALSDAGIAWLDWISLHDGEDMLFAAGGRVYRLKRWRRVGPTDYLKNAKMIADFCDMRFELIAPPPEETRW
jgi:hypothetical protein